MTHYLKNYAQFKSIEEMDQAVAHHRSLHRSTLNNSDQLVLDMIRTYSAKYGAAHLKHATIESAIGKSNSSVRRAIRKLEKLHIIQRIHFVRPVMSGLGANIYIILPLGDHGQKNTGETSNKPHEDKDIEAVSTNEAFFIKSITKDLTNTSLKEPVKLSTSLFSKMRDFLSTTLGESKKAREFYGIHLSLSGPMLRFDSYKDDVKVFEELAYRALMITVMATKRKSIDNLPGYFKGVLRKLIDETYFKDLFMCFDTPVDGFYFPAN